MFLHDSELFSNFGPDTFILVRVKQNTTTVSVLYKGGVVFLINSGGEYVEDH